MNKTFNPKMLTLAREARELSQSKLSEVTGLQQSIISKIEQGFRAVDDPELKLFSESLGYPESFFFQSYNPYPPNTDYRKREVSGKIISRLEAMMNIYRADLHLLLNSVELPDKNFPIIDRENYNPLVLAKQIRSFWGIPKGPIKNLTSLFEDKGIVIIMFDFGTDKIDGRSMSTKDGHPIIFLNSACSGDRIRLTLAHEGGHIFMHVSNPNSFNKSEKEKDQEAWLFAVELLMPSEEVRTQLPPRITLDTLSDLKRYWKISMQAILKWLERDQILDKNQSKYLWYQISSKRWKRVEPIEIEPERPTLLNEIIHAHMNDLEYTQDQLSGLLCLHKDEYERLYHIDRPKLKIVR